MWSILFGVIFVICTILVMIKGPPDLRRFLLTGIVAIGAVGVIVLTLAAL